MAETSIGRHSSGARVWLMQQLGILEICEDVSNRRRRQLNRVSFRDST